MDNIINKFDDKEKILIVKNIYHGFTKEHKEKLFILNNVSLSLNNGEIVGLLGRSGSGKSTLLRIISGLIKPISGEVFWLGNLLKNPAKNMAMVFQTFALFPWLTVLQNVEIGLEALGINFKERRSRSLDAIDLIGLDGFENAYPRELSGGMRQRVGFARALVVKPILLLMDEPFSALDVLTADTLRRDLLDLWIQNCMPKSILIVTHNIEEAVFMCNRILLLSSNSDKVIEEIKIKFQYPRNKLSSGFQNLVDEIYSKMISRKTDSFSKKDLSLGTWLPKVSTNLMAGLIEKLSSPPYCGYADMPELARTLHLDVDNLFPIAEILQSLEFANIRDGDIYLTSFGKTFSDLGTQERKIMFANHLIRNIPLAHKIYSVLNERPGHFAPRIRFEQELKDFLPDNLAKETLDAVINWGRYAEIFSYDDQIEIFSLEDVNF